MYEIHSALREWYEDETLDAIPCVQCEAVAKTLQDAMNKALELEADSDAVAIILEFEGDVCVTRHYTDRG